MKTNKLYYPWQLMLLFFCFCFNAQLSGQSIEVEYELPQPICSTPDPECLGTIQFDFSITQICILDGLELNLSLDTDNDGVFDEDITNLLSGAFPDFGFETIRPVGDYTLRLMATANSCEPFSADILLSVVDCQAPQPVCINGLAIELLPQEPGVDADGDGDEDPCAFYLTNIELLLAHALSDCSGIEKVSINRADDIPDINQDTLILTCEDVGTVIIEVYAWDNAFNPYSVQPDGTLGGPNYDFCETYLLVQENSCSDCLPPLPGGVVQGNITNACGEPLVGVPVFFSGASYQAVYTNENGDYFFESEFAENYTVTPFLLDNLENGITQSDPDTLGDYYLDPDASPLNPYQLLAADVNWSGGISTFDMVLLSKVAMGISADFAEPYWRFIDADYAFPNPASPWTTTLPEVFSVNTTIGDTTSLNFVGIKLGDIDCSANTDFSHGTLTGNVYLDLNENCLFDNDEPGFENYILQFDNGAEVYYTTTDENGDYAVQLEAGNYSISVSLPNDLLGACQNEVQLEVEDFAYYEQDFGIHYLVNQAFLEVDIATNFLRRCDDNYYVVHYCNHGNVPAENATVVVEFDPFITVTEATVPYTTDDILDNAFVFEVGEIASQYCGSFIISVNLSCDAELGQTHCVNAHIFPEPELDAGADWDGSNLALSSICEPDSVRFKIKNEGEQMDAPAQFIVIEDDLIMLSGEVHLGAGAERDIVLVANGTTKRLEISQASGYPGDGFLAKTLEACGMNAEGTFSIGFATQFPDSDGDPFVSMNCLENVGPFDPNDKHAFPKGVGENHFIEANTDLEYLIRFQNVGTDTAFNVVIRDTLPGALQPASFVAGAASHPYRFEMEETGILIVSFENIQLPDSTTNEAESHGFFKFRISQKPDNPVGTLLENSAAIYFDFNEPVITKFSWHTIGADYLLPDSVDLMGTVQNFLGEAIENVEIGLQPVNLMDYTISSGAYHFEHLPALQDYHLSASYDTHPVAGVSTFDAVLIAKHILGVHEFTSPYQLLAADVNNSGSVTNLDIVMMRQLILSYLDSLPVNWQFLPANLEFPDPANPWEVALPDTFFIENLLDDLTFDIIGIKKGDVNGSFNSNLAVSSSLLQAHVVKTETPNLYKLDFYWPASNDLQGLQLIWDLPEGIKVRECLSGSLPTLGKQHFNLIDHQFRLSWNTFEAFSPQKEDILFTWLVEAKDIDQLQHLIRSIINSRASYAVSSDLKVIPIELVVTEQKPKQLLVHPNPTKDSWTIQFENDQASVTCLKLYNAQGQLVSVILADRYLEAGQWSFQVEAGQIEPGAYWLKWETENKHVVEKVVKM